MSSYQSKEEICFDGFKKYRDFSDYRYFFGSKEWIEAYSMTYCPSEIVIFVDDILGNYMVFIKDAAKLSPIGMPFNDYNGLLGVNHSAAYIRSIFDYCREESVSLELPLLFEEQVVDKFVNLKEVGKVRSSESVSVAISPDSDGDFFTGVSKRVRKMFDSIEDAYFERCFLGEDVVRGEAVLEWLLFVRNSKLNQNSEKSHSATGKLFTNFIKQVCLNPSLGENVYVDYLMINGKLVAGSLNFCLGAGTMCYLRAHSNMRSKYSYGLVLDCWSSLENTKRGFEIWDFTRGTEFYKYRLGGREYKLCNIVYECF